MNRKHIIAAVAVTAALGTAGCGSTSGSGSQVTVTKSVQVQSADNSQLLACRRALSSLLNGTRNMQKATTIYVNQIKPSYEAGVNGTSLGQIAANIGHATSFIHAATSNINKSNAYATICLR